MNITTIGSLSKKSIGSVLLTLALSLIIACGGGGGGGGGGGATTPVYLSGKLDTVGYTITDNSLLMKIYHLFVPRAYAAETNVDQLWIVPCLNDELYSGYDFMKGAMKDSWLTQKEVVDLPVDGVFRIDMAAMAQKAEKCLLVLVDSSLPKGDRIIALIGIADTATTTLLRLPTSGMKSDADLGTINAPSNLVAQSSKNLTELADSFTKTVSVLQAQAKMDNAMLLLKSLDENYNTGYHFILSYNWDIASGVATIPHDTEMVPDPDPFTNMDITFNKNSPYNFTFAGLTAATPTEVAKLVIPVTVTTYDWDLSAIRTYTNGNAVTSLYNNGTTHSAPSLDGDDYVYENEGFYYERWEESNINIETVCFEELKIPGGSVGNGKWLLRKGTGSDAAGTDLASAYLNYVGVIDSQCRAFLYVPSITVRKNASNIITAVEVDFKKLNGGGTAYEAITAAELEALWEYYPSGFLVSVKKDGGNSSRELYITKSSSDLVYTFGETGEEIYNEGGESWSTSDVDFISIYCDGIANLPVSMAFHISFL